MRIALPTFALASLLSLCTLASSTGCDRPKIHSHTAALQRRDVSAPPTIKLEPVPATIASALASRYRGPLTATVVTVKPTHGYTWLLVRDATADAWVAAPMLTVPVGSTVRIANHASSQEIDPDIVPGHIAHVLFATDVRGPQVVTYENAEHAAVHPLLPAGGVTSTDLQIDLPQIDKADHAIGELHVRRDELSGRVIAVRAQVVRVSPAIAGRHFVFLRDGTGDRYTSILPAIVTEPAEVGQVLTFIGRFVVGRRFLFGGRHPLLLEHARATERLELEKTRSDVVAYLAQNPTPVAAPPPRETTSVQAPEPEQP